MPHVIVIARDPLIAAEAAAAQLPPGVAALRYYAAELDLDTVFTQLGCPDLFGTEQAYHYLDFLKLKLNKAERQRLQQILRQLPPSLMLICTQVFFEQTRAAEKRALSGSLYQCWADGAPVIDVRTHSEGQRAVSWVQQRALERYRTDLNPSQVQRLLASHGGSPALVESELVKLGTLVAGDKPQRISDRTLAAVAGKSPGVRFYELVDAIMGGDEYAQELLIELYRTTPETSRLVGELTRRLLGLRALVYGETVQPPYLAQQLARLRRRWHPPRIDTALTLLARLEHDWKSGCLVGATSVDAELAGMQLFSRDIAKLLSEPPRSG